MKRCSKCKQRKPRKEFSKNRVTKDGLQNQCVKCSKHTPEKNAEYNRKKLYGITAQEYQRMLDEQNGACAMCLRPEKLTVDHCHQTGKVRGLLCGDCNAGIGRLGDNPVLLRRGAEYLEKNL